MAALQRTKPFGRLRGLCVLLTLISASHTVLAESADTAGAGYQATVLITGSNRGIGLEFARQYAEAGWRVLATARNPAAAAELQALAAAYPAVQLEALDVTDLAGIDRLAARFAGWPVDVLLNNAAISGSPSPQQLLGRLDFERFDAFMQTNVRGPAKVTEAFLPHVRASRKKTIVAVSSIGGSFGAGPAESRGTMVYRTSKAALNMLMLNVAAATAKDDVVVLILNPGLVDTQGMLTEMNEKMKLGLELVPVEKSVAGMRTVIDGAAPSASGQFFQWNGERLPF